MGSIDPSTGYTCVACHLVFRTTELQKEHYRTEWHRYNLKRQVAELPPITAEQFREKVLTYRSEQEAVKKEEEEVSALYCAACKKHLKSKNALANHIASKKHKDMETRERKGPKQPRKKGSSQPASVAATESKEEDEPMESEDDNEEEDDDSSGWETDHGTDDEGEMERLDEAQALPMTSCLFCPQTKPTKEAMTEHMRFHHGFQLPDRQYLDDEDGMLKYLGLKVGAGRFCIYCPERKARFNTVDACQKHMRDKEHCKLDRSSEAMLEFADFYDYSPMYKDDNESSTDVLVDDGWSLTLPSGAVIGHRSLMRFYKQFLRPVDSSVPRNVGRAAIDKARGLYPALTWTGTTGVEAKKVARDMRFVERYRRRVDLRVGVWSSKLFKTRGRVGDN